MTDKEKLIKIKLLADKMSDTAFNMTTDASLLRKAMDEYHQFIVHEYHKEEPVSDELEKVVEEIVDPTVLNAYGVKDIANRLRRTMIEPVSEELGDYINELSKQFPEVSFAKLSRIAVRVAKWQKENLWKPADGDDLPELERDVIVLTQPYPLEGSEYAVSFGHRPDPKGWDGKSVTTGKVEHYTPKTYDKGGWNIPDVKFWLDVKLPKEIEL